MWWNIYVITVNKPTSPQLCNVAAGMTSSMEAGFGNKKTQYDVFYF